MAVLVTRPQPGAAATARRLGTMGRQAVLAPMLEIVALAADLPAADRLQAVLVTSANALPALSPYRALPLLAVGDATAARARQAGFATVLSAAGDAPALAALCQRACDPGGKPLLLAGQQGQGQALAAALRAAGFGVEHHAVYAARPATALPDAAHAALRANEIDSALFFSAATAHVFVALAASLPAHTFAGIDSLALSPAVATALTPLPWRRIRTAATPVQDELLGLLT